MVTHDLNTLAGLASHVAVLADQHIVAFGPEGEIMTVDHPFVTGFFGADRRKLL
jgi:phospholipid/cholesterol/gamma-HCH transport system ATP-binding protein